MKAAAAKSPTPYDLFTRADMEMWIDDAVATERERCAQLAEKLGAPGIAAILRKPPK